MSLKEPAVEVFSQYGLTENDINVYIQYLGLPYATVSEVQLHLEPMGFDEVKAITDKLEAAKFLKKVPGKMVDRYIPLEPYFSLFNKQSENFRSEISKIKDSVLADQSKRFEQLDGIDSKAVGEVDAAVNAQVADFFKVSDEHDADKKAAIDKANSRFTETAKQLESDLHKQVDDSYQELKSDVDQMDADAAKVWDDNSSKFTSDNEALNKALDEISANHVNQTNSLEKNIHAFIDEMNSKIKGISAGFVEKFETGINDGKGQINKIIDDLLADFSKRLGDLEVEVKKDLDAHVDFHKEHAEGLKPKLEEILEKYLERMNAVVEDLKKRISKLLFEHEDHVKSTTNNLANKLKDKVKARHDQLSAQVKAFEDKTVMLIENLKDISDKMTDLASTLSSRGSAWKALFLGKHKDWVALWEEIDERVNRISGDMKVDFTSSTSGYIQETGETSTNLQGEIDKVCADENQQLKTQSDALDKKAQDTVNAELEGLATDLSTEIDETLKTNIKHCQDTTLKLKDSAEKTLHSHKGDYEAAINTHRKTSLDHYSSCDADTKKKNSDFLAELDTVFNKGKLDTTAEKDKQNADINKHLQDTKAKNVEHSKTFASDVAQTKEKQKKIFTERLTKVRADFDAAKQNVSDKIGAEISTFDAECKEMDEKIHAMLDDHKNKYKENATTLQQSLTKTVNDNTQNNKDAIADFTLSFMNAIDEAHEIGENTEEKLTAILNAAKDVKAVPELNT
ncbi:MAG: hypothetical protein ACTSU5_10955, partial [Promethearchaeota archaeon]